MILAQVFTLFMLLVPPAIATYWLAKRKRREFLAEMDSVLGALDHADVQRRVQRANFHNMLFAIHLVSLVLFLIIRGDALPVWRILWIYVVLVHLLELYLYHVRWNPTTLARKRKLDDAKTGRSLAQLHNTFDADAHYSVGADGELIRMTQTRKQAKEQEQ